jgi:hypothetical protein
MTWRDVSMDNFVAACLRSGFDSHCPDCEIGTNTAGRLFYRTCGRDKDEHQRYLKLIAEAEQEAQKVVREIKERNLLPKAIIKAAYDEAEREARRLGR